jgi:hypothetical protein
MVTGIYLAAAVPIKKVVGITIHGVIIGKRVNGVNF